MNTVAEEDKSATPAGITFKNAYCEEMSYRLSVTRDKFDVDKFRENLLGVGKTKDKYGTVCAPRDPKSGDYHLHAEWFIDEREIRFTIDYERGTKKHEADEREPYAEQFMGWLGQFFKHENAHAHIHAQFVYPIETRESKFLLPLKTNLGPKGNEAEINGISLVFPSQPEGVLDIWVARLKARWRIQMAANRRIVFKEFTPYQDMRVFVSAAEMVIEEKKT